MGNANKINTVNEAKAANDTDEHRRLCDRSILLFSNQMAFLCCLLVSSLSADKYVQEVYNL